MKKTFIFLSILAGLMALQEAAHAIPLQVERRDMKLATQQMVEKQTISNPAAAGTTDVLNASAGPTSAAAASVTTFVAQPDVPRNLVITPGTSTVDVAACTVTVTGTNIHGASMTETFPFVDNQASALTGALAFNTVTSVAFPANCEDGAFAATWSIGYGEKLGLKRCMDSAGHLLMSTVSGAYEATRPTVAVGSSVQGNTADFNGTMNGSADFEAFFFQNFTCFP